MFCYLEMTNIFFSSKICIFPLIRGLFCIIMSLLFFNMDRVKRIWYLSLMRAAKVQASLRIRAVSPEPPLLAHASSESRGTFRQKARSLAPLDGWACAVKICHDGMLEDTNSLDGAHIILLKNSNSNTFLSIVKKFRWLWYLSHILEFIFLLRGWKKNLPTAQPFSFW